MSQDGIEGFLVSLSSLIPQGQKSFADPPWSYPEYGLEAPGIVPAAPS